MITERVKITNDGAGMDTALALTDRTAEAIGLDKRGSFHLRLLAEEMFSMFRAVTGNLGAEFWIEEEGRTCRLNLSAKHELAYSERREFLSVATGGKNSAPMGIMDKLREVIEAGLYGIEESFAMHDKYGAGMFGYGAMDIMDAGMSEAVYAWSMQKYKSEVEANLSEDEETQEAWDELEKSIMANVADEVKASVRRDGVELVVIKNFAQGDK